MPVFSSGCLTLLTCFLTCLMVRAQEGNYSLSNREVRDTAYIRAFINKTEAISEIQYPDSVIARYLQAATWSRMIPHNYTYVYCMIRLGACYVNLKQDHIRGRVALRQALPYLNTLKGNQRKLIPILYNLLGNTLYRDGQNDSAIYYYSRALTSPDSLMRPETLRSIYSNMGGVLIASKQYARGLAYLKKSLSLAGSDTAVRALNYANLGVFFANYEANMDSASYWFQQAIPLYRALSDTNALQDVYANLAAGWLNAAWLNSDKAGPYLDAAVAIAPHRVDKNADLQRSLSLHAFLAGKYQQATSYALHALELFEQQGERGPKIWCYTVLSYCYAYAGNMQQALKYLSKQNQLSDSIYNENVQRTITEMETKYRLEETQKELAQNKARVYQQRLWLSTSIGGGLIAIGILLGVSLYYRQRQKLQRVQMSALESQQQIETMQVRMEAEEKERARIAHELHDGIGVLISAARINYNQLGKALPPDLSGSLSYKEGREILDQINGEIRTIAHNLIPDYITHKSLEETLSGLIAKVSSPTFLVSMETFGISRELHPERSFSVYRILEEIINNTMKHAQATELIIQLLYHPHALHILSIDNGKGFELSKVPFGMGLKNIERRVENLHGQVSMSSKPGEGTSFILEIPYQH